MAVSQNKVVTAQGVQTAQATCTAAKTTYTDATNGVLLLTAGANGGVLYGANARPRGALAAATKVMLFTSLNGTTLTYIGAALLAAYAADAATTIPTPADFGYTESAPRRLAPLEQVWIGGFAAAANGIIVDAQYENL